MPNPYSLKLVVRILEKKGFFLVSQKGSHAKYRKEETTVIVPIHGKEIPYGTFRSILRQSNLSEDDFNKNNK